MSGSGEVYGFSKRTAAIVRAAIREIIARPHGHEFSAADWTNMWSDPEARREINASALKTLKQLNREFARI